jgi:hypothetical protein
VWCWGGDRAEDLEEHAADRGGGVDALIEYDQVDAALLYVPGQLEQVVQRAAEPVVDVWELQLPRHQSSVAVLGARTRLKNSCTIGRGLAAGRSSYPPKRNTSYPCSRSLRSSAASLA